MNITNIKALDGRSDHVVCMDCPSESVASSLENMMVRNNFLPSTCCIFKTPSILYRHKEEAYIPNAFSFGPFHHGKPNLTETEKIKSKYLQCLIARSHSPEARLKQCIDVIKEVEEEARACYAGTIGFSHDEFVKILVLDACFIVELFRKDANLVSKDDDDPVFTMSCMLQYLFHDLILLENQIPWLVLERIFSLTASPNEAKSLVGLTLQFFSNIFSSDEHSIEPHLFANQEIKHILDLLRKSLILPYSGEDSQHCLGWQPFPSATSIKEAGIEFRRVSSSSILDIRFRNGILEMPSLLIQETTETIFRNLISFEQCYPNCSPGVASYVILLSNLINTSKDLDILCGTGIIDNWLIPEDSTKFFKALYHDSYVKEFHYLRLCENVNGYCHQWRSRWNAFYKHNYLGKPWAIVSGFAVATFLILTFIQTYYIVFK
ncbi:hypothetical protein ERO13_D04G078300v2 [Gossypium hirsutum]|uniref:UPF0481 protein At3g47200 n=1 Tax=Gossypium hirsutum TaxID=3635 RepID=A0A1U8ISA4_GOSHI|nr:UPF0481 protein At3g47200-like [Gossypium hirsutum]KAG4151638.1 hypothetical protein ERO13_D04G078300v2 [Gossypium hirsutum]